MNARRVVIVGGGASGVLVAARIMDASLARPMVVTIVEPTERLAAGVAYGTDDPDHLLNVRASGMSADPSDPHDLVRWAGERSGATPDTFLPRREFRRYLLDHLRTAVERAPDATLEVVHDVAESLSVDAAGCVIGRSSGPSLRADRVVLAVGNPPPGVPRGLAALEGSAGWIPDPWATGALQALDGARDILLVGTGLTMVDVAITLGRDGTGGRRLQALSRRGLLPSAHVTQQPVRPLDVIDLDADGADVIALAERIRRRCALGEGKEYEDEDWREVIDAIRPYANALWQRFDREQRRRFLAQVMRDWDIHRHRMSPATAARFEALRGRGTVSVHTGEIVSAHRGPGPRIDVDLLRDGIRQQIQVDAVVNCTGPGRGWEPPANPLVVDLIKRGLAAPDPFGLGLCTTASGQLLSADGTIVERVLVIGPPRRGTLFETTAIPELRSQALHIADLVTIDDDPLGR